MGLLAVFLALAMTSGCKVDQAKEVAIYRKVIDVDTPHVDYQPGQPLTLETAFALANQSNERLPLRGEDYLQAIIAKDRVFAAFQPSVSLVPNYSAQDRPPSQGGTGFVSRADTSLDVPIDTSYNVFNGFRDLYSYKSAGKTILQRWALLLDVGRTYYQVLRSERSVAVLKNSVTLQEERVRDTRVRLAAGLGKSVDVAQNEAQLSATKVTLISAENDVRNARTTLSFLIGVAIGAAPLEEVVYPKQKRLEPNEYKEIAVANRQDLAAAREATKAARFQVEVAFGQYYPTINVNFNYFLSRDTSNSDWSGFVTLNQPLFTAGRIHADVRTAWSLWRQAKLNESATERQVMEDTELAFQDLQASEARLVELPIQIRAASDALTQAEQLYKLGTGTNLDRLTAQNALLSAELQLASERFDHEVFRIALYRAIGRLSTRLPGEPATMPTTQADIGASATKPTTRPIP